MKDINCLNDTVELMNSRDYTDRFRAEYHQLKIRTKKLEEMLHKWDREELDFVPSCSRAVLQHQWDLMTSYLATLEYRAIAEDIQL